MTSYIPPVKYETSADFALRIRCRRCRRSTTHHLDEMVHVSNLAGPGFRRLMIWGCQACPSRVRFVETVL